MLARDEQTAPIDWVARAQALVPLVEAAGDRNEAERRIAPEVIARAARGRPVPHAAAFVARRRCGRFSHLQPDDRNAGRGRCQHRLVSGAGRGEHAGGGLFGCKDRPRSVRSARRRHRLGSARRAAKAVVADGGYVVTGRWRFASGSEHCPWLGGHSAVFERDGKPQARCAGAAGQSHHAVPQGSRHHSRHLARHRPARHPQQRIRGAANCSSPRPTPPGAICRPTAARLGRSTIFRC